jgi:hypothetical protein
MPTNRNTAPFDHAVETTTAPKIHATTQNKEITNDDH